MSSEKLKNNYSNLFSLLMFQNGKNSQFTACMLLVFALVQHLSYETVVQNVTRRIGKLEIMVNFYARCCAIFLAENILNEALFV